MFKKIKLIVLIVSLFMLIMPNIVNADEVYGNFIYRVNYDGNSVMITGYDEETGGSVVSIPNVIDGKPVTIIGGFANKGLTKVTIPQGLKRIGDGSFENNKLTELEIPSSVNYIGDASFRNNLLKNLTIQKNESEYQYIGSGAFFNNKLINIVIPNSVNEIIAGAFRVNELPDAQAFIYVRNSDGSIDNTTLIGYGGKEKNVIIPDNVTSLVALSFAMSDIESIDIPSTVTLIDELSFAMTPQLSSVRIFGKEVTINEAIFQDAPSSLIVYGYSNSTVDTYMREKKGGNDQATFIPFVNLTEEMISSIGEQKYNEIALTPEVIVTYNGTKLVKDVDYTLTYENNDKAGTGKAIIKGRNQYLGTIEKEFKITSESTLHEEKNPQTFDGIMNYIIITCLSIVGLVGASLVLKKELIKKSNF